MPQRCSIVLPSVLTVRGNLTDLFYLFSVAPIARDVVAAKQEESKHDIRRF